MCRCCAVDPGERGLDHGLIDARRKVGVALGRGDVGVAEEALDNPEGRAGHDELRGVAVSQVVRSSLIWCVCHIWLA